MQVFSLFIDPRLSTHQLERGIGQTILPLLSYLVTPHLVAPEYFMWTGSIAFILMSWFLMSPGYQEIWHWLPLPLILFFLMINLNYMHSINVKISIQNATTKAYALAEQFNNLDWHRCSDDFMSQIIRKLCVTLKTCTIVHKSICIQIRYTKNISVCLSMSHLLKHTGDQGVLE